MRSIVQYLNFDGVSIFFVLSGFLIGTILIKTLNKEGVSGKTLFDFWQRRWGRTLPAYYLILFIHFVLQHFIYKHISGSSIFPFLVFLQNFAYPFTKPMFGESWSLAVEEYFYLTAPVLIVLGIIYGKLSVKKSLLITACIVITATTGFRYYRYLIDPIQTAESLDVIFRKQVITRLD